MRPSIGVQLPRPLLALGIVSVVVVLNGTHTAAEPPSAPAPTYVPRAWVLRGPVPPQGPFFGRPAVPRPWPVPGPIPVPTPYFYPSPFPAGLPEFAAIGATDRSLVIASPAIDPRFSRTAREIDPGIFATPRVQGLPIRPAGR
jgi:hypothetical protein